MKKPTDTSEYIPDPDPDNYTSDDLERFCTHYGVDPDRVRGILRDMEHDPDEMGRHDATVSLNGPPWGAWAFEAHLFEALHYLPAEDALTLFEEEDLGVLGRREAFISLARHGGARWMTLEELADWTRQFIASQKEQREWLLEIGHPQDVFTDNMIDHFAASLHYTMMPKEYLSGKSRRKGHVCKQKERRCFYGEVIGVEERCFIYEDAVPVVGISPDAGNILKAGRPRLLEFKLSILEELLRFMEHGSQERLSELCIELITRTFTPDEMEFYFLVADRYRRPDRSMRPGGGLSDILYLIGYFEEEMVVGSHANNKAWVVEKHDYPLPQRSYYEAVGKSYSEELDNDIDRLVNLECEAFGYSKMYGSRIEGVLQDQFKTPLDIVAKICLAGQIREPVQAYADFLQQHYEATGVVPPVLFKTERADQPVTLTSREEEECEDYGYINRALSIEVTCETRKEIKNVVRVGQTTISLGDADFLFFLSLVVELFRRKEGYVSKVDLMRDGVLPEGNPDAPLWSLRKALAPALKGISHLDFIEARRGRKTIRLSTHPALIKYDKKALLQHDNARIRELAEELPD